MTASALPPHACVERRRAGQGNVDALKHPRHRVSRPVQTEHGQQQPPQHHGFQPAQPHRWPLIGGPGSLRGTFGDGEAMQADERPACVQCPVTSDGQLRGREPLRELDLVHQARCGQHH